MTEKIKLWSVVVNNWNWDYPKKIYGKSKEDCERLASTFPASDPVKYAGMYTKDNATKLIDNDWM